MSQIHGTRSNAPETSFYPALEHLLTSIGKSLNPKVRCVVNLANRGAGLPDGGLFTADQFGRKARSAEDQDNPFLAQNPSRGVLEAKPLTADINQVVGSEQVERYWKKYGMVLVTNFRSFALIGKSTSGQPSVLESFTLADSEKEFWQLATHPRKSAAERGERMLEYLRRVLLHNALLAEPKDVATILASYAHDARLRIEHADLPALQNLRKALEESLGLHFEGEKGEHFFRSTLVQTLFYGVFSAWVLWARRADVKRPQKSFADKIHDSQAPYAVSGPFDWKSAHWLLRVPMLRALFIQVADPARLGALGLIEVLDWTAAALNRVDRAEFFHSFDEGHAVQYFYEPFLHAFDPDLRKELGVWYTPEEIVKYQVERVDAVLKSELNLPDGLADPNVVVLDPCCGTGAYLRAVLRRIAVTLREKGGDALVANDLKKAAMERVFGFEILPAPFVIAHLQLGLELETLGAPLSDAGDPPERAGVYLTNALTGWEPPKEKPRQIAFPGFDAERDAAGKVKQEKPILVILGNPPYNGFAGLAVEEERDLSSAYRTTKKVATPQGQGLNDLYVRFFRMAERRIVEKNGQGVVCFISNYSWLDGLSFTGMRERYLDVFDKISIDCLNGDKYKTGKLSPEGAPDPSVFSTEFNKEGIQVGTAISTLVRKVNHSSVDAVDFRHFWGKDKGAQLTSETASFHPDAYSAITPIQELGLPFMPTAVDTAYLSWPLLSEIFEQSSPGVNTSRDADLVAIDLEIIKKRMQAYFDPGVSDGEIASLAPSLMQSAARFNPQETRRSLIKAGIESGAMVRYAYRPLDNRYVYWHPKTKLLDEKREDLFRYSLAGTMFLTSRARGERTEEGTPFFVSRHLPDRHLTRPGSVCFPIYVPRNSNDNREFIFHAKSERDVQKHNSEQRINLLPGAYDYLRLLGLSNPDADQNTAELLWYHSLAIGYSPGYLCENADGIRQDWPRIPLPQLKDALITSAALGRQVAALLDTETPIVSVTTGNIRDELKSIAVFQRVDGNPANPLTGDLDLTAGWGHAGKGSVTMPGKGKVIRRNDGSYDVYLNNNACWRNIPEAAWDYTIGGYQVIKKWLSYREKSLLGRGLTSEEVRYVTEMARRITALITLQKALDDNYRKVISTTHPWKNRKQ
ncbi:MAG: type ISP restriction/modification enzyme [Nitrospirota bacterium]